MTLESQMRGWQPIATAPKGYDGTRFHYVLFLGHSSGGSFSGPAYVSGWMDGVGKPVHNYRYALRITHWMPLPDPPETPAKDAP